ncbi:LamG-like jellyroll fold domain-containing protein [Mastigocoleus testarum]|uniref:Peptidase C1A papain C-terminal domain-containing protein n=1 Tax=Mastigocoleus testarum BC008 TaxID=371196 RepID=A0A0V7ZY03_9CYAN|nr:LamG-like jellyroll fold domain-containing protein [Mastigocoleus testarum]KST69468.1 hypothetical protein BC008_35705 [Mastigocoleus testarum BC008]
MTDYTFGVRRDNFDDRDYIVVDTLERLKEELAKLQQQGIKIGIWQPNRDKEGEPTNYEVKIYQIDPNQISQAQKEILVPLKPSISSRFSDDTTKINLHLPTKFLLHKSPNNHQLSHNTGQVNILTKALTFNGNNAYIELSDEEIIQKVNFHKFEEFTIELLIKSSSIQTNLHEKYASILEKWDGNIKKGYPFAIRYEKTSGKVVCSRYDGNYNQPQLISKKSIDDGEFHHVVFVKRDYTLYLYIDGELEDKTLDTIHDINSSKEKTQNLSNVYLGCRGNKENLFKGQIYYIHIWKVSFPEDEIKNKYFRITIVPDTEINHKLILNINFLDLSTKLKEVLIQVIDNINQGIEGSENINFFRKKINDYFIETILNVPLNIDTINQDILNLLRIKSKGEKEELLKIVDKYFIDNSKEIKRKILEKIFYPYQLKWHDDNENKNNHYFNIKFLDFNNWSKVKEQSELPSCTTHAAVSLLEYFERKASGRYQDYSSLFLYVVAFYLSSKASDNNDGLSIREVMSAMITFGVPPEKYFPYNNLKKYFPDLIREEQEKQQQNTNSTENVIHNKTSDFYPLPFIYSLAQKYKAKSYFRLDNPNINSKLDLLDSIKIFIYTGFPPMFGFQFSQEARKFSEQHQGDISFYTDEGQLNNHAVVAVGYDDDKKIEIDLYSQSQNLQCLNNNYIQINIESKENKKEIKIIKGHNFIYQDKDNKIYTKGAFKIRNSWGKEWGDEGYGWLPYIYVLTGLTFDWWSMLKAEWFDTDYFGLQLEDLSSGEPDESKTPQTR